MSLVGDARNSFFVVARAGVDLSFAGVKSIATASKPHLLDVEFHQDRRLS